MKSIFQDEKRCYICGTTYMLEDHHIMNGNGLRSNAEKYGLKIWLCRNHHFEIHHNVQLANRFKAMAQKEFEKTHTRQEWLKMFIRNYIDID